MINKLVVVERKGRIKDFTLIELLVVIAIIALLVSILVPSLKDAKKLAEAAACGVNLHNIYIAASLYANEYDRYPGGRYYSGRGGYGSDTVLNTLPGMLSPKYCPPWLFWCPAESKKVKRDFLDVLTGYPHPFWEKKRGRYWAMLYNAYEVGDEAWEKNENNERLAWGVIGSTYGIPMPIGHYDGGLPYEECLNTYPWISYGGTIDMESVGLNPEAMYMVDGDQRGCSINQFRGIEMWYSDAISERHKKPNYLTFSGSVRKMSKKWLVNRAYLGNKPWYFKWARGIRD